MRFRLLFVAFAFILGPLSELPAADGPAIVQALVAPDLEKGGASTTLDLSGTFALTGVSGPLVEFDFAGGKMFLTLFPEVAPLTVVNFLKYTDNLIYNSTIVHRSIPGFVVQAGGYQYTDKLPHVPLYDPVPNEFRLPNVAGTMAMAKIGGDLNSATSEWFVNLVANPHLDGETQKFTVFGRLIGDGLVFCQSIAALQTVNIGGAFTNLPVINYTGGTVNYSNLLVLNSVKRIPLLNLPPTNFGYLTLTATTSDSNVIIPQITSAGLQLTSGPNAGTATITVAAKDYYDQQISTTFVARSVDPTSTPTPTPSPIPVPTPVETPLPTPVIVSFAITLKASPAAYGTVKGTGVYVKGKTIVVKALVKKGRRFQGWSEGGKIVSKKANYSFLVSKKRVLTAVFSL